MKPIRVFVTTIAIASLLAVSGCMTMDVSPEMENLLENLPPSKKVSVEVSLLPGVTLPDEDLATFNNLLRKAMREHGGECYTYTDQKETADFLARLLGTSARYGQLAVTFTGEITHSKKEIFKNTGGWMVLTWPSHSENIALCVKNILCKGKEGPCSKVRK